MCISVCLMEALNMYSNTYHFPNICYLFEVIAELSLKTARLCLMPLN